MEFEYKTLLALDSIHNFLNQHERIVAIKRMLGTEQQELTQKMQRVLIVIEELSWQPPETKYCQDRLLYFKDDQDWKHVSEYKHEIINRINKIR